MHCPACGWDNPEKAKFCLECGARFRINCAGCGTELPLSAKFCLECGARVRPTLAAGEQTGAAPFISPTPAEVGTTPAPLFPNAIDVRPPDTITDPQIQGMVEAVQRFVPKEFAERLLSTRDQAPYSSERRMVTILFSDVKGSTALAETMDPEDMMEIMNGAFEYLIAPIYRHEGTLARLMGDAILAFFGAPIAHENDAERAIRAALAITRGIKEYAGQLERERGISGFNVRVGINTGMVVVGEVGSDLRVEYTAIGSAINLAARMEQNAPSGGVLITHDTYRHVRGVFDILAMPPLHVKGKTEPVQTYLVKAAKQFAFRTPTRGVEGVETRTIGREVELLALETAYHEVLLDRTPQVVTVTGDAGVGKSRLLYEFDNWIELRPEIIYFFKGRAVPGTQHVPYGLLRDMLAYRFDILDSDSAETALAKFRAGMAPVLEPEKADIVGQLAGFDFRNVSPFVAALLGSESFARLAWAYLTNYIRTLAAAEPIVIFLEDLHWADDSSLDFVAHLFSEIREGTLLLVGLARAELFERRPSWGEGQRSWRRIELQPLTRAATRELVAEILKNVSRLPTSLRDLIVDNAEGNPYYAEELVKMLIEDRIILTSQEADEQDPTMGESRPWRVDVTRLGEVKVPPTLAGILQSRLDALPAEERMVLQRAAVVGRQFWDAVVEDLVADVRLSGQVSQLLASTRARELVFRLERSSFAGTNEYIFKHAMLRDVVYESVLLKQRRRYHGQVAAWLETHAAERVGEYLRVIAEHYEQANDVVRAAQYLRRSGEEALKVSAFQDAMRAFQDGLRLLDPVSASQDKANLLMNLGQASLRLGQYDAAAEQLALALPLARSAADRHAEVAVLAALGEIDQRLGNYDSSEAHLGAALALARQSGDREGIAAVTRLLGRGARGRGTYDEATRWAAESRALCTEAGNWQGAAAALAVLGLVAGDVRDFEGAQRYHSESLALCQQTGDRLGAARALNNLGVIAVETGAFAEARGYFLQSEAIVAEIGDRWGYAVALLNIGETYLDEDQDAPAWRYLRRALQASSAIQDLPSCLYVLADIARLHARAGSPARAAELLSLALTHPASDREIGLIAQPALDSLRETLPAAEFEVAVRRGQMLDLGQVLQEIMAEEG